MYLIASVVAFEEKALVPEARGGRSTPASDERIINSRVDATLGDASLLELFRMIQFESAIRLFHI